MVDLVVTCPKGFWFDWIAEGDPAGTPESGQEWGWYMGGRQPPIGAGDRLYVVAWGRLRGWAPVTVLRGAVYTKFGKTPAAWLEAEQVLFSDQWCICRRGGAEAITISEAIPGFRGWRKRWWPREAEVPFLEWQTEGVGLKPRRAA